MGVDVLTLMYGWKFTVAEFFKLLIEHGIMRKHHISRFYIWSRQELQFLGITEQKWQYGVDYYVNNGLAYTKTYGDDINAEDDEHKDKFAIWELSDEPDDCLIWEIVGELRKFLDLDDHWLVKSHGHDKHQESDSINNTYIIIGKEHSTVKLHDLEDGVRIPSSQEIEQDVPEQLNFLNKDDRQIYLITDDCWCCS